VRKKSHISLAKYLVNKNGEHELRQHRKAFYIGSILPDLKPSFLTRRHNIEETFDILINEIKRITVDYDFSKGINRYYAKHLGVITHYLADYFTFPHNSCYTGSMTDHVYYEKELKYRLREALSMEIMNEKPYEDEQLNTLEEIIHFIKAAHREYLKALKAVKLDIQYIIELCTKVVRAILEFFKRAYMSLQKGMEPSFG